MEVVKSTKIFLVLLLIFYLCGNSEGRRGRGKGKKSGMQSSIQVVPPGGQWRDSDTAKYYTNPKGAKILKASHFDYEYVLGHKINVLCVAKGNPRPQITWYKDGIEIYHHSNLHIHEWREGEDKLKSKLEIDPGTQMDGGIYECYADNKFAVDKRTFRVDYITSFD